ncbi:hypothetical protein [Bacillus thuringiensis]|uniref:hypothetical protein n=1 Tax=Bacillus thuringiensis TaxID=1428 RepID=UPI0021D675D6|nr:hypothetical protein [Bacillus thuringiensis]MCU7667869.1 hypothetical protein [Bacillus thuringiensis]
MKKYLSIILLFCIMLFLAACDSNDEVLLLRLENGKSIETIKKSEFPATLKIQYYVNDKYKELTKNRTYTLRKTQGRYGPNYTIFEVKKVKDGYKVVNSPYENFTMPSVEYLGKEYLPSFTLTGLSGTIERRFDTYSELEEFQDAINYSFDWLEILDKDKK